MIETWTFYFFSSATVPPDTPPTAQECQAAFDRYLELWTSCERWGFDGLAFAEHHFNPLSLSPSPHLLVAAVAARTTTLRFTTLASVLALHDARRYVEEVGMLDYLTGGRFEPGIGPGAGDAEALKAGLAPEDIRPRYHSGAEVLTKAARHPRVTHHDEHHDLDDVPIVPSMRAGTGRSPWVTVRSPDSAAWAGERGYRLCTAWLPTPVAAELADRYRAAAEAAARSVTPSMLGLRRRVFVADSDAEAREKYEASVDLATASAKAFNDSARKDTARRPAPHPDDFAIGSPETVAEKLVEQCRAGGYGVLVCHVDFATFEHADLVRSHELIGRRVAPVLRSADLGRAARTGAAP